MTAPALSGLSPRQRGQHERFTPVQWPDQHGRLWCGSIDDTSGHPVGMWSPYDWRPPLPRILPDQKYLQPAPGKFSGRVMIDYDSWITDWSQSARGYAEWVLEVAKKQYPSSALKEIEARNPMLLQMAGQAPQHIDIVRAMKAGNKWALGIAKPDGTKYPMPPWAEPLVDSWKILETWGGVDGELSLDVNAFPDVEDVDGPLPDFVPSGAVNPWDLAAGQATNGADDDTLAAALAGPALKITTKPKGR